MKLTCLWDDCIRGRTMPSGYCIRHDYERRGLVCPLTGPGEEFENPDPRPALARYKVILGRQRTSVDAALRAYPRSGSQRHRIWTLMTSRDGMTADEVNEATGISPNTINPTIRGLVLDGWLKDGGQRRMTRSGNEAIVWEPIP